MANVIVLLTLIVMLDVCLALNIRNCINNKLDVVEPGTYEIFCDEIGNNPSVNWTITRTGDTEKAVATCGDSACDHFLADSFYAWIPTSETARLDFKANHRSWAGATLRCTTRGNRVASCQLRVIKPASVTYCSRQTNVTGTINVSGYCTADSMFDSDGMYTCSLQESSPNGHTREIPGRFRSLTSCGEGNKCATCEFSFGVIPQIDGTYTYNVNISPGPENAYNMTVEIQRPGDPSVYSCPTYIVEHADLTCYCVSNRDKPGKPDPILSWPSVSTNNVLRITSVSRTQNGHNYTCQQDWGLDVRRVLYQLQVAYPPKSPPVITGYREGDIITEGERLQLNCTVFGGNPPVDSVSLFCNIQQNTSETVVTNNHSSTTVSMTIREVVFRNLRVCICAANWEPAPSLYNVKTTILLTIAAAEIPRVKSLSLNDVHENLTVNASDNTRVIMSCAASGRPKPSIRVVRVDTGQPLEADTSHTSGQDENVQQYTLTTSARCQDAAIYRCEASNREGTDKRNVTLFVQCSPRLAPEDQSLGSAAKPFIISDAEIPIVAFPVPSVKEVVFLGTASGETDLSTDSGQSSTALTADCQPDGLLLYMSRCSVSVKNGATAENGIYRLTLNNAVGSVDVYVKLDLTEEGSLEQSQGVPTVAIAGGVAAAVVVIIVIATVVVIFLRRKKSTERHKEQANADDEGFEEHINAVYGMEDTSGEDPKEKPQPPVKPTAVAWRISAESDTVTKTEDGTLEEEETDAGYSSVSTGRNQQPTIMPSRDNLNGDESVESDEDGTYSSVDDGSRMVHADRAILPQLSSQDAGEYATTGAEGEQGRAEGPRGDVYAVVDKTKKKQQSSDHTSSSVGAENSGTVRRGPAGDVYAVVDKTKKRGPTSNNTGSSPAASAQSPSTSIVGPGGDVYAQVNKSSGRDKARGDTAQQVQGTQQPATGNNTSQKPTVKPKPAAKPKPALRPKPSTTPAGDTAKDGRDVSGIGTKVEPDSNEDVGLSSSPESPSSTSDAQNITTTQTTETDDEYNTLRFEDNRPMRGAEAGDAEYSHIGFI